MTNENFQRNRRVKSYLLAVVLWFPPLIGAALLAIFIPKNVPHYVSLILYFLLLTPFFIVSGYLVYKALVPVTGGMPFTKSRQWALLYPVLVGLGLFWALLSLILETLLPNLPKEDSQTTIPILIIAGIVIIVSTTRLRYPVARMFNRLFGTEPTQQ